MLGTAQGDVIPSRWRPGSSSPIKPVSKNATSSLHALSEGCFWEARPPRVALFGPSVVTQVQRPDPLTGGARGVARPKPGPGRGAGPAQGDVTPSRWQPGSSSQIKPVSKNATWSLHAHWEGCFREAGPPRVALFGPSVVTHLQRPDPWTSGARGVARPKPGPGRGAGPAQGDVTPGKWRPGSSSPIKPVSQNATSSLHAHSEGCFGEAGTPRVALFGPSVVTQVQ